MTPEEWKEVDRKHLLQQVDEAADKIHTRNQDSFMIVATICQAAAKYFEHCPRDFCLQHCDGERIIFGGTNRLIWTARSGFVPSDSHCTERFLANFDSLQ
jgi:hypothetical protein